MATRKSVPKAPPRVTPNKFLIALKHKNMDVFKCEWSVGDSVQLLSFAKCGRRAWVVAEWAGQIFRRRLLPVSFALCSSSCCGCPPGSCSQYVYPWPARESENGGGTPVEPFRDRQTGSYLSAFSTSLYLPRLSSPAPVVACSRRGC